MAPPASKHRRTARRSSRRAAPKRDEARRHPWRRTLLALTLLLAAVALGAFMLQNWLRPAAQRMPAPPAKTSRLELRQPQPPPAAPLRPGPQPAERPMPQLAVPQPPTFEIYPKRDAPREPPPRRVAPKNGRPPQVAIIIDDIGYDRAIAERLMALDGALTFSMFPDSPFGETILRLARSRGVDLMLHLPMEPNEYPKVDPGPGALLTSMESAQLTAQLKAQLDALPEAKGVNNHMGSRLTADRQRLAQIFSVLKDRGLYFIDSRTTPDSAGREAARQSGVSFAERDVFLDHRQSPAFIRQQLHKLIQEAQRHGSAIGIAHPHDVTYEVLRDTLPDLRRQVQLVPASRLVRPMGIEQSSDHELGASRNRG
jgi:hypothetical protein